jgi:hypothetical protein
LIYHHTRKKLEWAALHGQLGNQGSLNLQRKKREKKTTQDKVLETRKQQGACMLRGMLSADEKYWNARPSENFDDQRRLWKKRGQPLFVKGKSQLG